MKKLSGFSLALVFAATSTVVLRAADTPAKTQTEARVPFADKTIWIEPKGGTFHPVITAGNPEGTYVYTADPKRPNSGLIAVYATDGHSVQDEAPIARYMIPGMQSGSGKVELTFKLDNGLLSISAKDAHGALLAVTRLDRSELAKASLPAPKTEGNKPAAIGELKGAKNLASSVGLRSASGTLVPFLSAGAAPGETATVVKSRRFPGQTTADIAVYQGDSPYVENDKKIAHYLISGLSPNPNARFALQFTVEPSGKVKLASATDTSTKAALTVHPYSEFEVARLKENFAETPAPVAARGN